MGATETMVYARIGRTRWQQLSSSDQRVYVAGVADTLAALAAIEEIIGPAKLVEQIHRAARRADSHEEHLLQWADRGENLPVLMLLHALVQP